MNKPLRLLVAVAVSMAFVIVIFFWGLATYGSQSSFLQAVDLISAPAARVAQAIVRGHRPAAAVIAGMTCTIIYYTVVVYVAISVVMWLHGWLRRRRDHAGGSASGKPPSIST